jgi:hypothetical protein
MARGVPLTPEQIEAAAEVFARTQNVSEAARAIGVPVSTLHSAFARAKIVRARDAHARACERGLRLVRRQIERSTGFVADRLREEAEAGEGLEPRDLAALLGALARSSDAQISLADREDRRRVARLARNKTRAETALTEARTRALVDWDEVFKRASSEQRARLDALAREVLRGGVADGDGPAAEH